MEYEKIWKILKAEALRDAQMGLYDEMERLEKQKDPQPSDWANVHVCPSCNKMICVKFPPGITTGLCPYCNAAIELSPLRELILSSGELLLSPLEKKQEQQPGKFDFKEYLNQWKKIYPLILNEVKQMELEFNQMRKPKPAGSSQAKICVNCKYIIKTEGLDDAYAKCAASAKFDCVTGKEEIQHCYAMNRDGACQKYEIKQQETKEEKQ